MDCNSSENKATLVFATNNAHKLEEVRDIIGDRFEIKSLDDIGCHDDIPETADTLQGNALQKARYIKDKFGYDCFADDTGLICSALNGEPGVRSARYANDNNHEHDSEANMKLLLKNLSDKNDRSAYFMTVIALIYQGQTYTFNGVVNGVISHEKHGDGGFGYDPIFVPEGYDKTFAELGNEIKNTISHRARAVAKLDEFLKSC
ncbi:MAG: non-canonical purine NTP diphosphatase [Bacteroidaceae bacterium]|nr:non-canonical purine NTP diphosphatase [Bacteroidaceae bacterium]